jgi:hypothetical protein
MTSLCYECPSCGKNTVEWDKRNFNTQGDMAQYWLACSSCKERSKSISSSMWGSPSLADALRVYKPWVTDVGQKRIEVVFRASEVNASIKVIEECFAKIKNRVLANNLLNEADVLIALRATVDKLEYLLNPS